MKTTTWLCPVLTLLCATKLAYTAQKGNYGGYELDNVDNQMLQNDYFLSKRNKPSLSIVNPLDVLRQRLLLEIARRQMKENSRQVELNRAILKNVGKRMANKYSSPLTATPYDIYELKRQQQQLQLQLQEPIQQLQPYEYELIPTTLIFDYLQKQQQQQHQQQRRPLLPYESTATQFDNNYINDFFSSPSAHNEDDVEAAVENAEQKIIALNEIAGSNHKNSMKHTTQTTNEDFTSPNEQRERATLQKSITNSNNRNDDTKPFTLINNHPKNDLNLDFNDANPISSKTNANEYKNEMNNNDGDYQLQRYFYHLHNKQNHLTRK